MSGIRKMGLAAVITENDDRAVRAACYMCTPLGRLLLLVSFAIL